MPFGNHTIITTSGETTAVSQANGPYYPIQYFLPIYDHRISNDVHLASSSFSTSAIEISASWAETDTHASLISDAEVEIIYNTGTSALYTYDEDDEYFLIADGTETVNATSVTGSNQSNFRAINKFQGSSISDIISGDTLVVTDSENGAYSGTNISTQSGVTSSLPAQIPNLRDGLFDVSTYAPITSGASEARGIFKVRLDNSVGNFLFNKIGLYITRIQSDGTEDLTFEPVLFAIVALPDTIKINTGFGINVFECDVELAFNSNEVTTNVSFVNDSDFIKLPSSSLSANDYGLNFNGSLSISETSADPMSWFPNAKVEITTSNGGLPNLRLGDETGHIDIVGSNNSLDIQSINKMAIGSVPRGNNSISFFGGNTEGANDAFSWGNNAVSNDYFCFSFGDSCSAIGDQLGGEGSNLAVGIGCLAQGRASVALGEDNSALEYYSFAGGQSTSATGLGAVSFGDSTLAAGDYSLAIGDATVANGDQSFSFGFETSAIGAYSLAGGNRSQAIGVNSFSYGLTNITNGVTSFAFGSNNVTDGLSSHTMGVSCSAIGNFSFAFGDGSLSNDVYAFSFGYQSISEGRASLSLGESTSATDDNSVSIGFNTLASNTKSISIGDDSISSGPSSLAIGHETSATASFSISVGNTNVSSQNNSIAIGSNNTSSNIDSVAIGENNESSGFASVAIGKSNQISGQDSFGVGNSNVISGTASYSFGVSNDISGNRSYVIGSNITTVSDNVIMLTTNTLGTSVVAENTIGILTTQTTIGNCDNSVIIAAGSTPPSVSSTDNTIQLLGADKILVYSDMDVINRNVNVGTGNLITTGGVLYDNRTIAEGVSQAGTITGLTFTAYSDTGHVARTGTITVVNPQYRLSMIGKTAVLYLSFSLDVSLNGIAYYFKMSGLHSNFPLDGALPASPFHFSAGNERISPFTEDSADEGSDSHSVMFRYYQTENAYFITPESNSSVMQATQISDFSVTLIYHFV